MLPHAWALTRRPSPAGPIPAGRPPAPCPRAAARAATSGAQGIVIVAPGSMPFLSNQPWLTSSA